MHTPSKKRHPLRGTLRASCALALIFLTLGPALQSARAGLVKASADTILGNRNNRLYVVGFDFTVDAERVVDALGVEDDLGDGLIVASAAGLWDVTEAPSVEIATVAIPSGTEAVFEDGFRYVQTGAPITLLPGRTYRIGAVVGPDIPFTDTSPTLGGGGAGFFGEGVTILTNRFEFSDGTLIEPVRDGGSAPTLGRWSGGNATLLNPSSPQLITSIKNDPVSDMVTLTWKSQAGFLYNIRESIDLTGDPAGWNLVQGDIASTPPENTIQVPSNVVPVNFFVVEEFPAPPPPPLFFEDFENGATGWTVSNDGGAGTDWQLGDPAGGPATGPTVAYSTSNCYGTNISANYAIDADVSLYSPIIAIPIGGATLSYWRWLDTDLGADVGSVNVLDADDGDVLLATLETGLAGIEGPWSEFTIALPAVANGKNIKLQFRFVSDANIDVWAGWYIDDVAVTTP